MGEILTWLVVLTYAEVLGGVALVLFAAYMVLRYLWRKS